MLTADTTLDGNLTDCPADGVVIGAAGITLDLNGHTIDGDATMDDFDDVGVDNGAGHDGVTIEDGAVREFVAGGGVRLSGANGNRVRRLKVDASGIALAGSNHNQIVDNSVSHGTFGILLAGSNANVVERNSVSGASDGGIVVSDSHGNQIRLNSLRQSLEIGILVRDSNRNAIVGNATTGVPFSGLVPGTGIAISGASNLIAHNTASKHQFGILVGDGPEFLMGSAPGTRVVQNVTTHNRDTGVLIAGDSPGTLLERNVANRNGGHDVGFNDGINVQEPSTTIRRNTANHNSYLGIEAVPGVTDGGANKAAGNGNPVQCTNVACS